MSDAEPALKSVLERPGDLAARLAYADALSARQDPLGEFIRLDCGLSDTPWVSDDNLGAWDRRYALLEAHAGSWLGPLKGVVDCRRIERGLVDWVMLDLDAFLEHGAEIFGRYPVQSLAIRGIHGRVAEFLASPWVDRIKELTLYGPGAFGYGRRAESLSAFEPLDDDDVAELAASDRLRSLQGLDLEHHEGLGPRSVERILDSPWCDRLEMLRLKWTAVGDEGARLIASSDRLESLRRLELTRCGLGEAGIRALADSPTLARLGLTEFICYLNDDVDTDGYVRLLRSPVLAHVESICMEGHVGAEMVDALMTSDSLGCMKSLHMNVSIDTIAFRRLMRSTALAGLESLTFVLSRLTDEHLGMLGASRSLSNLKALSLSETRVTEAGIERFCRSPVWGGLEELGIDRHALTERSVRAILDAHWFPRLKSLDLHASYEIGDAGAQALASYRGETSLRRLVLSLGGLGDAGALSLAEAPFAPQLWTLWLLGNEEISPEAVDILKARFGGRVTIHEPAGYEDDWRFQPSDRC
ncbi:TIGR02996 domain-containing protein [Singulisphaera sp. PoT]|uniref:TIGR02996 domain-containing protein n=1 Tax=Singulisphaera sp. PoT TaxID=3411797 RepID=UPI003BF49506